VWGGDTQRGINPLLVGFGQTVCSPLRPKCESCAVNQLCPSAFAEGMYSPSKSPKPKPKKPKPEPLLA
jgi:endonuclease-3